MNEHLTTANQSEIREAYLVSAQATVCCLSECAEKVPKMYAFGLQVVGDWDMIDNIKIKEQFFEKADF